MLDHPARTAASNFALKVPAPGIAPMFNVFNPATAYMEFWKNSAMLVGGRVTESWLHFLGQRWLKDLELPQRVAQCKTAGDFGVALSLFWQEAAKDYSTEINEIADLTWKAMRQGIEAPEEACTSTSGGCCGSCSSKQT